MRKHQGTLFVEALIGVAIFLIGVIAVASALAFSLRAIVQSREAIASDMQIANVAEEDIMYMSISPDVYNLRGTLLKNLSVTLSDTNGARTLNCKLYRYKDTDKYKTTFYILGRQ